MNQKEVSISVKPVNGTPYLAISGPVDSWHCSTVEDVFDSFVLQETPALGVDISAASFSDIESISCLIRALRVASREMTLSVVASDSAASLLSRAGFDSNVVIKAVSETNASTAPKEYYSSRFVPRTSTIDEMPLAA